jgi:hypothetical protein
MVHVQFYRIWDNISFFLEFQGLLVANGFKSKYQWSEIPVKVDQELNSSMLVKEKLYIISNINFDWHCHATQVQIYCNTSPPKTFRCGLKSNLYKKHHNIYCGLNNHLPYNILWCAKQQATDKICTFCQFKRNLNGFSQYHGFIQTTQTPSLSLNLVQLYNYHGWTVCVFSLLN